MESKHNGTREGERETEWMREVCGRWKKRRAEEARVG